MANILSISASCDDSNCRTGSDVTRVPAGGGANLATLKIAPATQESNTV
jgi:hypothetical protein